MSPTDGPCECRVARVPLGPTDCSHGAHPDGRVSTREWARWPHLFDFNSQPREAYLCLPGVASERRPYFTAARFGPDVITSNAAFTAVDPDGFQFSIVSSSMFLAWQRSVGGRLKSDLRFSNTVVWSNLPLPAISSTLREGIILAGRAVLAARDLQPNKSLAQHYQQGSMTTELLAVHDQLDELVDRGFGAPEKCATERERQEILFARYEELTAPTLCRSVYRPEAEVTARQR